ncbi:MAG TPA: anthranilate/aminodeoxychorismate synthase component II, partial [Gammaproteobacteria bacterium]|nr:anthranilate/aminodeoxychorismate synthase component II [Gammaproteobacteria bacterium]
GAEFRVVRNDEFSVDDVQGLKPSHIVISPGPCTPNEAGISMGVIDRFRGVIPILGVCLGHQSIGQVYGGAVVRAPRVMHGKTSEIFHTGVGVFSGLPSPFVATRYHSLVLAPESLPDTLEVTAWTSFEDGSMEAIMGVRQVADGVEGVQFHPESILTEHGHALLNNFLTQGLGV